MGNENSGRPTKFENSMIIAVEAMAKLGLTDEQMAEKLDINTDTFYVWKKEKPLFSEAIKRGKEDPDSMVESALLQRAKGYSHMTEKVVVAGGVPEVVVYQENFPPDPTSMIFWLKNRRPAKWRDKQELEHSGEISYEIIPAKKPGNET